MSRSSRFRRLCGLLCLLLSISITIRAQQAQPTATVSGTVNDPDNELIPGATVTLTPVTGTATVLKSGSDGTWGTKVAPGTYAFTITMPGFAAYVRQGIKIAPAQALTLNAKMVIETTETVQVTTNANTVSVDPDSNASSTILTGAALDALSDDPDELSSELSALAGPSAGPNGGQIYIDGFTGGQLPPKSSIREIRINQNPFSAQYDRPGFGRVEIFTKPGTDKFHGSAQLNGNDKSINSGSPFLGSAGEPGYHTVLFFGNLTGPLRKNASFAVGGSYRDIQDNYIVDPSAIYATTQTSGVVCQPGQAGCSIFQLSGGSNTGGYTFAQFAPQTRWDIAPRLDIGFGEKNSATIRYQYENNNQQSNGIGGSDLVSTGYNTGSNENTIQISDTQIFSSKIINETRFEFQRDTNNQNPYSTAPTVAVLGAFTGGGATSGLQADLQNHVEVQNYTSIALAKNFIRFGGRLRTTGETNTSFAGQNGTLTYTNITAYATNVSTTTNTSAVNQYSQTIIEQPTITVRETDLGLYAEDDWKIRPNLTFSYGLRYEAQNFIHDKHDFAPRIAVAYGVGKKTVLRAGFGLFYDRFQLTNELSVFRNNLTNQQQYIVSAAAITAACTPTTAAVRGGNGSNACLNLSNATPSQLTQTTIAPVLRSPYIEQTNVGVDQQLFTGMTLSVNYQNIHGVHQFVSQDANYPINGVYPVPAASATTLPNLIYQFQSEGVFEQNQLVLSTNYRGRRGSLFGFFLLNNANSDTSGATSFSTKPYDLKADYGRASFSVRSRLFLGGSFNAPHNFTLSPFLVANSGQPYNVTTGRDNNNDSIYNDRPAFANGTSGNCALASSFNAEVGNANYTEIPVNYCTGPANFSMNLRVVKTFGFGPSTRNQAQGQGQGGPGGPPGGGRGPGGGGRGGPGGGGFGGGGSNTGKRYNFSIGAQGQNLFNIVDRGTPVGTLTSPTFGTSTQLAGMFFTSNSAVRRIQLQASFNF